MARLPYYILKLGFFLLYNHLAFTYDLVAWLVSFGQWADWRRTGLQYLQTGPTLELAYGTGGLYLDMLTAGLEPVGIDLSPYMARLTHKKLQKQQRQGAISQAQAQALPFTQGYFCNAIATFPTPYIFEPETLAEIYRVLSSNPTVPGRLIIVLQGELQGRGPLKWLLDWLYRITGERDPLAPNPIALLAAAGFKARWVQGHYQSAQAHLIVAEKQIA